MEYKYLKKWCYENNNQKLSFKTMYKKQDQYFIQFKNNKKTLQINLSSKDCYLFFTEITNTFDTSSHEMTMLNTHLSHSNLNTINIDDNDRIIYLQFEKFNIYNQIEQYTLIFELISKFQNIILTKKTEDNSIIIDCLKKISYSENTTRQILPGLNYEKPSTQYKPYNTELSYPLFLNNDGLINSTQKNYELNNMNELFNLLYYQIEVTKEKNRLKNQVIKKIENHIKKKTDKICKLELELTSDLDAQEFKKKGDLLLANYHLGKQGMNEIKVLDFFTESSEETTISLDQSISWQHNIDRYFKKYRKSINGKEKIENQINLTKKEIILLNSKINQINSLEDFNEISDLVKSEKDFDKQEKAKAFRRLIINENWEIWIGRSSTENDLLTCKSSQPNDWWFHTRVFQGTHVVLRNFKKIEPAEDLLMLCCRLAAYYSRAKNSSNVPVDYTQIRYVRKPRGSAPGYVTYTNQKTIFVEPISFRDAGLMVANKLLKV